MDEIEERKKIIQEIVERMLSKYEKSDEFKSELKVLLKKYPLNTDVNFEPSTFHENDSD